jgi:hypothetical protein
MLAPRPPIVPVASPPSVKMTIGISARFPVQVVLRLKGESTRNQVCLKFHYCVQASKSPSVHVSKSAVSQGQVPKSWSVPFGVNRGLFLERYHLFPIINSELGTQMPTANAAMGLRSTERRSASFAGETRTWALISVRSRHMNEMGGGVETADG